MLIYKWGLVVLIESLLIVISLVFLAKQSWDMQAGNRESTEQLEQLMTPSAQGAMSSSRRVISTQSQWAENQFGR
jgi:hypothetical protein